MLRLEPSPAAVGRARATIDRFEGRLPAQTIEDARLLVSELVTNSLRHASLESDQEIEVSFSFDDRALRVEVVDPGRGFRPRARSSRDADATGWGLFLVARLADRWGVRYDGSTCVWFELDVSDQPGPRSV
jgi:anti-sigma regulatory factor (Ser/Thr protein kinase)